MILALALLCSFTANARFQEILNVTDQTVTTTSTVDSAQRLGIIDNSVKAYSVLCNLTGATFSVVIEIQASLDGVSWVTVGTTLSIVAATPVLLDVDGAKHRFARIQIIYTSGTYSALCHLEA